MHQPGLCEASMVSSPLHALSIWKPSSYWMMSEGSCTLPVTTLDVAPGGTAVSEFNFTQMPFLTVDERLYPGTRNDTRHNVARDTYRLVALSGGN